MVLFQPLRSCSVSGVSEGALVFCRDGAYIVKSISGSKVVIKGSGNEKTVKLKELSLIHPGAVASVPEIVPAESSCEEVALLADGEPLSFSDFAALMFGDFTPASALSAYLEIVDGVWFVFDSDGNVVCREEAERVALVAEREAKEAEKLRRAQLIERVRARAIEEGDKVYLREVESVALGKSENSKLMREVGVEATAEKAHKLLLELGVWDIMRNPWPERMKEDTAAPEIAVDIPETVERVDLTHLEAWAIDDKSSNDPDDAMSFADGLLYVHIADPAEYVRFGGEIEKEASLRGESLYLPELLSPMLPEDIRLKCALGLEKVSNAMTFVLKIDDDGDVTLEKMMLSKVAVTRLAYEDCAPLLENPDFAAMQESLERFRDFRVANGARLIRLPEVKVKVCNDAVEITPLPITFERELVANAMLAAGYAVAKYMIESEINFPFVVQAAPDEEPEGETLSAMFARRRTSKVGVVDFRGGLHSGLGLEPYSRVTSPLRRYADLLAHYQLRSLLLGTEPVSYEELESRMTYAENAAASRRKLEKYSNEYYTVVYLAQHPGYETVATLVAKQNGQLTFLIPELAYEYKCRLQGRFELDEEFKLVLTAVDVPAMRAVFKVSRIEAEDKNDEKI